MDLTKEEYITAKQNLTQRKPDSQNDAYKLMYVHYLHKNTEWFNDRNRITNYGEFIKYLQQWFNTPVVDVVNGAIRPETIRQEDINTAINKTLKYFDAHFKL